MRCRFTPRGRPALNDPSAAADTHAPAAASGRDPARGHHHHRSRALTPALLLGVLGVVYGDIGTSPLYALKTCVLHFTDGGVEPWEVIGLLSMILWCLILTVTVKYIIFILSADNRGEGGVLALMALALRSTESARGRWIVALAGMAGASLFFADGTITPAISVLSAMEGLKVISPAFEHLVIPLSLGVLIALFLVQYRGTGSMGRAFGPVMAVWFGVLGLLGLWETLKHPYILMAFSPYYAVTFFLHYEFLAFAVMGSVVLAVTGAEALYADMGHFGSRPIRVAWLFYVLPALALNYLGQGALLLSEPEAIENPFFLLAPEWFRLPYVVLATAATIIASQAMISGAFSVARQCVQLGFLPRLLVRHTSETEEGQIYVPQVNFALLVGVVLLTVVFKTSDSLAAAYGIAVTGTFVATSALAFLVFRKQFGWPRYIVAGVFGPLLYLDVVYFVANLLKVPDGGYVPLVIGAVLITLMTTWYRGRQLLFARFRQDSLPLKSFVARLPQSRTIRVPGIAVFMTGQADYLPSALLHNLKHNKVLHERVLFVTVQNEDIPEVAEDRRRTVEELSPGIYRVMLRYGFQESPNVPRQLEALRATQGVPFDPMQASYFLGRETVVQAVVPKMSRWQQWVFTIMSRNSVPATEYFCIPSDRVVELGVRVAI
jgi:KUP system potassium uptake protein